MYHRQNIILQYILLNLILLLWADVLPYGELP